MTRQIEAALQEIANQFGGRLTPDLVVRAARDPASPLHDSFTWDVTQAAEECWRDQARRLIRSVKVSVTTEQFSVRVPYFVRDPSADGREQGYSSLPRLRSDQDQARDAVVAEFARASSALARAKSLATALSLDGDIEEVLGRVEQLSERAQQVGVVGSA